MHSIKEWIRWLIKKDWELIDVTATSYNGWIATELQPYFIEVWRDKRTDTERIINKT